MANLLHHLLRPHSRDLSDVVENGRPQAPPDKPFEVTTFGREIQNSIPVSVSAKGDLAPAEIRDMVQYQFRT